MIAALSDDKLSKLADNARREGARDLLSMIEFERAARIFPKAPAVIADRVERLLRDYEEMRYRVHGRRVKATRTRRAIQQAGLISYLEKKAFQQKSLGLQTLEEAGVDRSRDSFEAIISDHPQHFSEAAVAAARAKLKSWQA